MRKYFLLGITLLLNVTLYALPFGLSWGMSKQEVIHTIPYSSQLISQNESELLIKFTTIRPVVGYELFDNAQELLGQTIINAYFYFTANHLTYIDLNLMPAYSISDVNEIKPIIDKLINKIRQDDNLNLEITWIPDEKLPDFKGYANNNYEIIELSTIRPPKEGRFYPQSKIIESIVIKYSKF